MTARTTHTDEEHVTSGQLKHSVDLGDVDNGVSEQDNVHLCNFRLIVISLKLAEHVLSQGFEVIHFLVVALVLGLQEINEDGVSLTPGHAVVLVLHLEVLLQDFVQKVLQFVLITKGNKSVMENSQDFVAPQFNQVFLGVLVGLLCKVESLEHL